MFSFFRSAWRRSRAGMIEMGIVTEECVVPERQSNLSFVIAFFHILVPNCWWLDLSFQNFTLLVHNSNKKLIKKYLFLLYLKEKTYMLISNFFQVFFTVTLKLSSTSLLHRSPLRALSISLPSLRTFRRHTHRDHPGGAARRRKTGLRQLLFCEVCKHHDLRNDLPSIHLRS